MQYWGGPTTYSEQRGHPRLRMRHAPYRGRPPPSATAGCAHMRAAVDEIRDDGILDETHDVVLRDYLVRAAHSMVNTFEEPQAG